MEQLWIIAGLIAKQLLWMEGCAEGWTPYETVATAKISWRQLDRWTMTGWMGVWVGGQRVDRFFLYKPGIWARKDWQGREEWLWFGWLGWLSTSIVGRNEVCPLHPIYLICMSIYIIWFDFDLETTTPTLKCVSFKFSVCMLRSLALIKGVYFWAIN